MVMRLLKTLDLLCVRLSKDMAKYVSLKCHIIRLLRIKIQFLFFWPGRKIIALHSIKLGRIYKFRYIEPFKHLSYISSTDPYIWFLLYRLNIIQLFRLLKINMLFFVGFALPFTCMK